MKGYILACIALILQESLHCFVRRILCVNRLINVYMPIRITVISFDQKSSKTTKLRD